MYFIAKGEVSIHIVETFKNKKTILKNLRVGSYFGEIAMIYGCKRTSEALSEKYSTLAKLSKTKFQEISMEFPNLEDSLKQGIYSYNDKQKDFLQ